VKHVVPNPLRDDSWHVIRVSPSSVRRSGSAGRFCALPLHGSTDSTWLAVRPTLFENTPRHFLQFVAAAGFLLCAAPATGANPPAIAPRDATILYDGKTKNDLSSFYTWTNKHTREDPDRVFTVVDQVDGAPAIRISGQHFGGIVTHQSYTNYRLVAEFRWGSVTFGERKNKARDSGILLHMQGEDGNNAKTFRGAWSRSVEYQILEGGTGDIWLVNGYERGQPEPLSPRLTVNVKPGTRVWDPNGTPTEFKIGRIAWQHIDPEWKPVLGFRGRNDVEKPLGQWNRIEAICDGGDVTYFLNDMKVNEGRNGTFKEGRILFQAEGAEIFFRRIELHPLKK
jgi:hypothetical protein